MAYGVTGATGVAGILCTGVDGAIARVFGTSLSVLGGAAVTLLSFQQS